jgi:glycerol uptake facilitator-like aquaporin
MKILPDFNRKEVLALFSEFLATGIFIFTVCCIGVNVSRTANATNGLIVAGVGTALVAYAVLRTFGDWSGAHFNPAVTVGVMVGGKMNPILGLFYIIVQVFAGVIAVFVIKLMFPNDVFTLLVLAPAADATVTNALITEVILSFILVFVVYGTVVGVDVSPRSAIRDPESGEEQAPAVDEQALKLKKAAGPGAIAACLGFLCFLGTSSSGGAFNPVRATAPALLTWDVGNLWIYWVGDLAGAALAAALHTYFFAKVF